MFFRRNLGTVPKGKSAGTLSALPQACPGSPRPNLARPGCMLSGQACRGKEEHAGVARWQQSRLGAQLPNSLTARPRPRKLSRQCPGGPVSKGFRTLPLSQHKLKQYQEAGLTGKELGQTETPD